MGRHRSAACAWKGRAGARALLVHLGSECFHLGPAKSLQVPLVIEKKRLLQGETLPLLVWETNFVWGDASFQFQRRPDAPVYGGQPSVDIPLTAAGLMIGRGENADKSDTPRLTLDPAMRAVSRNQVEVRKSGADYVLVNHNSSTIGRTILNGDQSTDQSASWSLAIASRFPTASTTLLSLPGRPCGIWARAARCRGSTLRSMSKPGASCTR